MTTRWMLKSVLILSAAVITSCSSFGSSGSVVPPSAPTSTFAMPELEFGRGSMPPSIPTTFPMPESAVVGATMMAGSRNLTEVVATYPADVDAVAGFYTANLPGSGYQVVESAGTAGSMPMILIPGTG